MAGGLLARLRDHSPYLHYRDLWDMRWLAAQPGFEADGARARGTGFRLCGLTFARFSSPGVLWLRVCGKGPGEKPFKLESLREPQATQPAQPFGALVREGAPAGSCSPACLLYTSRCV